MALPKLETASLAPPPPPTRLEQLNRLNADIKAYTPALQNLFSFALGASIAASVMVGAATMLLFSIGAGLFALYNGAKMAVNNA